MDGNDSDYVADAASVAPRSYSSESGDVSTLTEYMAQPHNNNSMIPAFWRKRRALDQCYDFVYGVKDHQRTFQISNNILICNHSYQLSFLRFIRFKKAYTYNELDKQPFGSNEPDRQTKLFDR